MLGIEVLRKKENDEDAGDTPRVHQVEKPE